MRIVWKNQPAGSMLIKLGDVESRHWIHDYQPTVRESIINYARGRIAKHKKLERVVIRASAHMGAAVLHAVLKEETSSHAPCSVPVEPETYEACEEKLPQKREEILTRVRAHAAKARQWS